MPLPRIYADFNAIEYIDSERTKAEMALTGYGTLRSLARQSLRLEEGMTLLLYEPNDIECEGVAHFEMNIKDPAGRVGQWVARIKCGDIRECKRKDVIWDHPCIECGTDLVKAFGRIGGNYKEHCPACGASIMAPMLPPDRREI